MIKIGAIPPDSLQKFEERIRENPDALSESILRRL